ncbi:hypothetical protein BDZ91DRAFT_711677 [Kalaharituber pfeilii]|nr:hypothetical protein BDZ91DRAFT_711677 [Kalaharituber pfeilii]
MLLASAPSQGYHMVYTIFYLDGPICIQTINIFSYFHLDCFSSFRASLMHVRCSVSCT